MTAFKYRTGFHVAAWAAALCLSSIAAAQTGDPPKRDAQPPPPPPPKDNDPSQPVPGQPATPPSFRSWKATDLVGRSVRNREQAELGRIEELAVDPESSRVAYVVLSRGSSESTGTTGGPWFAVPWNAMAVQPDDSLILDVDESVLESSGGFDRDRWPNMTDPRWATEIHRRYGQRPYWEGSSRASIARAIVPGRQFIGRSVRNTQNNAVGSIQDYVIDPDRGRIVYGVLAYQGDPTTGNRLYAVPMSSFDTSRPDDVVLNVDRAKLQNAPHFDRTRWPDMKDRSYVGRVYNYYGVAPYWEGENPGDGREDDRPRESEPRPKRP